MSSVTGTVVDEETIMDAESIASASANGPPSRPAPQAPRSVLRAVDKLREGEGIDTPVDFSDVDWNPRGFR